MSPIRPSIAGLISTPVRNRLPILLEMSHAICPICVQPVLTVGIWLSKDGGIGRNEEKFNFEQRCLTPSTTQTFTHRTQLLGILVLVKLRVLSPRGTFSSDCRFTG